MAIKLPYMKNYRKASLWAENCPNFLAGTSPDFGAGKTSFDKFKKINYSKASLWAENCPNFLAGTSPKGARKTNVFSGKKIPCKCNMH
jgi:hypothetical protein